MKAVVFTLGCKVNECESGSLIRGLEERGYIVSDKLEYADLYIINTCAVTAEAEKKSRQTIARVKKYNEQAKIIICGCASEHNAKSFSMHDGVSVVTGARQKSKILDVIDKEGVFLDEEDKLYDEQISPHILRTRNFVKVQDGCNRFCSYCIIPYLRGRSRSRNIESAAKEILSSTALETVITGIDISSYEWQGQTLSDLLLKVKEADTRIRLGSLEISAVTEELLKAATQVKDFAPQFHLSLQSGSNSVLKKMNRKYTREEYLATCEKIYAVFPNAAITTDIIVGFCGETEEDFADSLKIVEQAKFAQVHCFPYSVREGTVAAKNFKDLPAEIKKVRLEEMLQKAEMTRKEYVNRFLGKILTVVAEGEKDGYIEGYTENYIRVYIQDGIAHQKYKVKLTELFEEGAKAILLNS